MTKQSFNEEDDVQAEQRERIKMILRSYDDTDSTDGQINSESEDEIIEDVEQVAAYTKSDVELNKTVEDKESSYEKTVKLKGIIKTYCNCLIT